MKRHYYILPILLLITGSLCAQYAFTKPIHVEGLVQNDSVFSTNARYLQSDSIPAYVLKLTKLKVLSINGDDCDVANPERKCWMIHHIPADIKNLTSLKSLALTLNAIDSIPAEIAALKNLKYLDLTDNPGLSNIDNIATLKSLEEISLYGCSIKRIPDSFAGLKKLRVLGLTGNHFSKTEQDRVTKLLPDCKIYF